MSSNKFSPMVTEEEEIFAEWLEEAKIKHARQIIVPLDRADIGTDSVFNGIKKYADEGKNLFIDFALTSHPLFIEINGRGHYRKNECELSYYHKSREAYATLWACVYTEQFYGVIDIPNNWIWYCHITPEVRHWLMLLVLYAGQLCSDFDYYCQQYLNGGTSPEKLPDAVLVVQHLRALSYGLRLVTLERPDSGNRAIPNLLRWSLRQRGGG